MWGCEAGHGQTKGGQEGGLAIHEVLGREAFYTTSGWRGEGGGGRRGAVHSGYGKIKKKDNYAEWLTN